MNPYLILSSTERETELSRVLSYWLNPYQTHGLKSLPAQEFIRLIEGRQAEGRNFVLAARNGEPVHVIHAVQTEVRLDLRNQIDLVLTTSSARFFVEVKIWAGEGDDQIERYLRIAPQFVNLGAQLPIVVFLTPEGRPPESIAQDRRGEVVCLAFVDLDAWLSLLMMGDNNPEQHIGLSQFRDWVRHIISMLEAPGVQESFEEINLINFWHGVRNILAQLIAGDGRFPGWSVRYSNGNTMTTEGPRLDLPYSKLGMVCVTRSSDGRINRSRQTSAMTS